LRGESGNLLEDVKAQWEQSGLRSEGPAAKAGSTKGLCHRGLKPAATPMASTVSGSFARTH